MSRKILHNAATRRRTLRPVVTLTAVSMAVALATAPLAATATAGSAPATTTDRVAVALVNFRNASLTDAATVHAKAVKQFFTGPISVSAYYAANSHNQYSVVPTQGDGVFGPFALDFDNSTCDNSKIADLTRKAMPAGVSYEHLAIVMPTTPACSWWGLGGGQNSWFQEGAINNDDTTAAVHEFGHDLGLPHSQRELCPVGQFTGCKGDTYSHITPMGSGGDRKGLSAPELRTLNWLPSDEITSPSTSTIVHLKPLHAPVEAGGARVIDIPLGTSGSRLVMEYRAVVTGSVDTDIENPGVFVFRVDQGRYSGAVNIRNTTEDKHHMVGSFTGTDPMTDLANHISISYSGMTVAGVDVHLDFDGHGSQPKPSTATGSPKPSTATGSPKASAASASARASTAATTPKPSASPTSAPSDAGYGATELNAAPTPSGAPSDTPTLAAVDNSHLAKTGANVTVPAVIATGAIGLAAVFVLRTRRIKHRRG